MDLTLATSKALVDALFDRYPDAVFIGATDSRENPDESLVLYQRFQGHGVIVQGLLTRMVRKVQDAEDYDEQSEEDL